MTADNQVPQALTPCEHCEAPTHYRLAVGGGLLRACCGRFPCEVKLRDGVDVPARPVTLAGGDEAMLLKLRWMRGTVGVDIERMFARALKENDGRARTSGHRPAEEGDDMRATGEKPDPVGHKGMAGSGSDDQDRTQEDVEPDAPVPARREVGRSGGASGVEAGAPCESPRTPGLVGGPKTAGTYLDVAEVRGVHFVRKEGRCGGAWTFSNSRMTIDTLVSAHEAGEDAETIHDWFPQFSLEQVAAALELPAVLGTQRWSVACRRCSECRGENHHWLEASHPPPPQGDGFNGYECKHCDARAEMCDACGSAEEPGHVCEDDNEDGEGWAVGDDEDGFCAMGPKRATHEEAERDFPAELANATDPRRPLAPEPRVKEYAFRALLVADTSRQADRLVAVEALFNEFDRRLWERAPAPYASNPSQAEPLSKDEGGTLPKACAIVGHWTNGSISEHRTDIPCDAHHAWVTGRAARSSCVESLVEIASKGGARVYACEVLEQTLVAVLAAVRRETIEACAETVELYQGDGLSCEKLASILRALPFTSSDAKVKP